MIKQKILKSRFRLILLFLTGILIGGLSVFPMVFIQRAIDFLDLGQYEKFAKNILIYTAVYIFVNIFRIAAVNLFARFEIRLNKENKEEIVHRLLSGRTDILEDHGASNTFNTIIDDLKSIDGKITPLIFGLGFSMAAFLTGSAIVIMYDYLMLFVIIGVSVISTFIVKRILAKSKAANERSQIQRLALINTLYDIVMGARDIRLFGREESFIQDFHADNDRLAGLDGEIVGVQNKSETLVTLLFNLIMASIILLGGLRLSQGGISIGALVSVTLYASMITDPVFNIIENQKEISVFLNAIKRIDLTFHNLYKDDSKIIESFNKIELKNISLKFEDNTVLDGFNMSVFPGDKIRITGKTGTGKSSVAKLITRLYKPSEGKVLIDGDENTSVLASVVFQENKLFNMSVLDNIRFKADIDPKILNKVIDICRLQRVIDKYLDKSIGFDSSSLSGGEKTRVLIARALCRNSELYIFDEISTGLDPDLFEDIFKDIMDFLQEKTVIVIDHRVTSNKYFNKSVCL